MAHEHIEVSDEWRAAILRELHQAEAIVCLLSRNYLGSVWCIQEAGIAAFKSDLVAIPLILDGVSLPPGFLSAIQGRRCNPELISARDVIQGLLLGKPSLGIESTITMIGNSTGYRIAEANYELLLPHLATLTNEQALRLLTAAHTNNQVLNASLCAREYIPQTLRMHGRVLQPDFLQELIEVCQIYGSEITIEDISP